MEALVDRVGERRALEVTDVVGEADEHALRALDALREHDPERDGQGHRLEDSEPAEGKSELLDHEQHVAGRTIHASGASAGTA